MRWAVLSGLTSAGCLLVAYVNREPAIEGAYFNSAGEGSYTLTNEGTLFEPFEWWDGYLWLGAGVAMAVVSIVVLAVTLRISRT